MMLSKPPADSRRIKTSSHMLTEDCAQKGDDETSKMRVANLTEQSSGWERQTKRNGLTKEWMGLAGPEESRTYLLIDDTKVQTCSCQSTSRQ
jgi:hypothetical protein